MHYPHALFAPHAILDDATCELLASIGPLEDLETLEQLLGSSWSRWDELGRRLFAYMRGLEVPPLPPLPPRAKRAVPTAQSAAPIAATAPPPPNPDTQHPSRPPGPAVTATTYASPPRIAEHTHSDSCPTDSEANIPGPCHAITGTGCNIISFPLLLCTSICNTRAHASYHSIIQPANPWNPSQPISNSGSIPTTINPVPNALLSHLSFSLLLPYSFELARQSICKPNVDAFHCSSPLRASNVSKGGQIGPIC
ncbi:hypothetical protein B0H15DRAFT_950952 [Mycena belliarum]|uniref:Uncharacterized protein n=1 Tax=Mycena belliarum TaxID=1033014 RepID=A0AAD6U1Q5_9AGAR|nr:hypothetical protein B0H15DRAFT_950952 [Mycena belliae]